MDSNKARVEGGGLIINMFIKEIDMLFYINIYGLIYSVAFFTHYVVLKFCKKLFYYENINEIRIQLYIKLNFILLIFLMILNEHDYNLIFELKKVFLSYSMLSILIMLENKLINQYNIIIEGEKRINLYNYSLIYIIVYNTLKIIKLLVVSIMDLYNELANKTKQGIKLFYLYGIRFINFTAKVEKKYGAKIFFGVFIIWFIMILSITSLEYAIMSLTERSINELSGLLFVNISKFFILTIMILTFIEYLYKTTNYLRYNIIYSLITFSIAFLLIVEFDINKIWVYVVWITLFTLHTFFTNKTIVSISIDINALISSSLAFIVERLEIKMILNDIEQVLSKEEYIDLLDNFNIIREEITLGFAVIIILRTWFSLVVNVREYCINEELVINRVYDNIE